MELLERVVREDRGVGPVRDLEDEGVASPDHPRGWGDDLAGEDGLFVLGALGGVDAVAEGGIDHDGQVLGGVFLEEGPHRFVELGQAGKAAAFGRDVGPVDDDVREVHEVVSRKGGDEGAGTQPFVRHRQVRHRCGRLRFPAGGRPVRMGYVDQPTLPTSPRCTSRHHVPR